jgi:hypothetical protein
MPTPLPKAVTKRGKGRPVGTKKLTPAEQIARGEKKQGLPNVDKVRKLREVPKKTPSVKSLSTKKALRKK